MPATDRTYEFFWRQAARWLAVAVARSRVGRGAGVRRARRSRRARDRRARRRVRAGGRRDGRGHADRARRPEPVPLATRREAGEAARHVARRAPDQVRPVPRARRGAPGQPIARRRRPLVLRRRQRSRVRGSAAERRRAAPARRRVRRTGISPHRRGRLADSPRLRSAAPSDAALERRDLWHEPWAFALVLVAALRRVDPPPPLGAPMSRGSPRQRAARCSALIRR